MGTLTINFVGMSLIVANKARSEALLIKTNDPTIPHSHAHWLQVGDQPRISIDGALLWIEGDKKPLAGGITFAGPPLAALDEICKGDSLKDACKTDDPKNDLRWREFLAAWIRLPGGKLQAPDTHGPGGESIWEFPAYAGNPARRQKLTQLASLTQDVSGSIELVLRTIGGGVDTRVPAPANQAGDFKVTFITEFDGTVFPPAPTPGDRVQLDEMRLLYKCLNSENGPVPTTKWPQNPSHGGVIIMSDPVTGICPIGSNGL